VAQVAVVHAGQAGRVAVQPGPDARADREHRAGRAGVDAAAAVLSDPLPELGEAEDQHPVRPVELLQVSLERRQPFRDDGQTVSRLACVAFWLAWVSKPPSAM
jgi:hypothetical protein